MTDQAFCRNCRIELDDVPESTDSFQCRKCGGTKWDLPANAQGPLPNLDMLMFQQFGKAYFDAYVRLKEGAHVPVRLNMLGLAIELAGKSLFVAMGNRQDFLKKKLGHKLTNLLGYGVLDYFGIMFSQEETTELEVMSDFHNSRVFQYPWFDWSKMPPSLFDELKKKPRHVLAKIFGYGGPVSKEEPERASMVYMLSPLRRFPDESLLESVAEKLLAIDLQKPRPGSE